MGIKAPIVVYTHTDMKDVWPMFFGQLNKYFSDTKIYVAVNKDDTHLSDYIRIIYDDSKLYTDRWKEILPQIKEETIMFMHEDMILFDSPNFESIDKYIGYVNDGLVNSIKMIFAGDAAIVSPFDNTLVRNEFSKFSVQPTIVKVETFKSILNELPSYNIWDFEQSVATHGDDFMVRFGSEKKRGIYHYDSLVFPYIATAINKGKWNMSEYQRELDVLFMEYGIVPFERGVV